MEKIIKFVVLNESHIPTGNARHFKGGELLGAAVKLQIVQYQDPTPSEYYLIYLDKDGKEMTDTCHPTIEKAEKQAMFEYQVKPEDWQII